MFKALFLALILSFSTLAKVAPSNHIREGKWDVSPIQVRYLSTFFAIELLTYGLFSPDFVKQDIEAGDYDFNKDDISIPTWLYQLGNHGPEILTIGMYGYYLFSDDEYAFEKSFVFTESMLISQGITFGTKYAANKQRPDETNFQSFPSGHTTHAFAVGAWMAMDIFHSEKYHSNYWMASLPLIYSSFIGWSRIDAKKHTFKDVSVGAIIGGVTSYFMYKLHFDDNGKYRFNSKNTISITPSIDLINENYSFSLGVAI